MSKLLKLKSPLKIFTLFISSFSFVNSSVAGVTHALQQTATTLQPGSFEVKAQADLILNRGGGINTTGHFRAGLLEDMLDIDAFIGTGKTDFTLGVSTKFNLLPDIPGQVGLAFIGGFTYLQDDYLGTDKDAIKVLNLATLVSKKVEASFGSVTPYGGLQIELLFKKGSDNEAPVTGIIGSEWVFNDLSPWAFFGELDVDINDSVFLFSVGGAYRF